jgi:predicted MPP superfamily phosphohydrolase
MKNIAYSSSPPAQPNLEVLEGRWLHKVMLFVQSFDHRPALLNWTLLLMIFGIVFAFWQLIAPALAPLAASIFMAAVLLDLLLLWLLPRRQISFGPIAPQLLVMLLPRLVVTALALIISAWRPGIGLAVMTSLQIFGAVMYLWGMLVEPHRLALTTLTVVSPHLPAGAPPIRLLHLSDLHLERLTRREARLLDLIAVARPDLIVITGDYLNLSYTSDPEAIAQVRSLLAKIDAPFGVYATLGSPPVDLPEVARGHFAHSPIRLLTHDVVELDLGSGRRLTLLGMDCSHDMDFDRHRFETLFEQTDGQPGTRVFLYHSPELMPVVKNDDINLYLCGHTHGGQVRIPGYGAIITSASTGKRYEMGRYDENGTTLYVSRGIGMEGMSAPRMRLFCPPEITLVEIRP